MTAAGCRRGPPGRTWRPGAASGARIAPSSRARREAEALLSSQAFFLETRAIQGPWQFAGSLSR